MQQPSDTKHVSSDTETAFLFFFLIRFFRPNCLLYFVIPICFHDLFFNIFFWMIIKTLQITDILALSATARGPHQTHMSQHSSLLNFLKVPYWIRFHIRALFLRSYQAAPCCFFCLFFLITFLFPLVWNTHTGQNTAFMVCFSTYSM